MNNWKLTPEQILTAGPIVPVIVINELSQAVPLAKALISGGVKVLEVTLRTECAIDAIRLIAQEVPEAIVGAGTVINSKQLQAVTEAGAQFAISPGLTDNLLDTAVKGSIPLIPGISSVSELMLGMNYGLTEFKFFPAEANGGVKALKAIAGPFSQVRFCPTGGISPANYRDYLALDSVLCIGGSWIVPADALQQGDYARITQLAKDAVAGAAA
ncbi:bifunctional 4-hydroxy-2-oxoglutarate aldolase/2-dehydro-3-deoxy-phosphogluconate aldolase [Moellerella wisconsensis]|uniref:bifunctional 4-hydroxy-2-oxoglutarate aldolase/2-dehydro-3-deoxy-phosphogluconate aldolase n=1 Tax=Moellerella wisconsensis TaxID=158849 RepID=UPI001F4DD22B|nr:bifunctional 4-hydroxy-2-oxoglutarate aldolase/2-dehydro-3-deoxy-phosphogluconate aldolase [Moellerella wisconsensis]UNH25759.1 bifunctional 4-hydroxy-2-oxoglutarate aldolase/2-dehydro-3-deoxy-phosphogluconate aldolase [Moellerella wisconsensis]